MASRLELTQDQTDELTEALLDCQPMQSVARRLVILNDLRLSYSEVVDSIASAADNRTHTYNIVFAFRRSG
jgi:hypothetical protein